MNVMLIIGEAMRDEAERKMKKAEGEMDVFLRGCKIQVAKKISPYHREIKTGVWVDVYDILNCTDPSNRNSADDHAIKKMLFPGKRGVKGAVQDRKEAIQSLERSIQILESK